MGLLTLLAGAWKDIGNILPISYGGTGTSRLFTPVSDANYTVLLTDRVVGMMSITAARTISLPAAAQYPQGLFLRVIDVSGSCSSTLTLLVSPNGSDTINGSTAAPLIYTPYGYIEFVSNGNGWAITDQSNTNTTSNVYVNLTGASVSPPPSALVGGVASGSYASMIFDSYSGSSSTTGSPYWSQFIFRASRGTPAAPVATQSGDTIGSMAFRGYNGSAFSGNACGMFGVATQTFSTAAIGAQIQFKVVKNGATAFGTPAMTIDQTQFIGIGTNTPACALDCVTGPIRPYSGTVAQITALGPVAIGSFAYASNCRVEQSTGIFQSAGNGSGGHVCYTATGWCVVGTNVAMAA